MIFHPSNIDTQVEAPRRNGPHYHDQLPPLTFGNLASENLAEAPQGNELHELLSNFASEENPLTKWQLGIAISAAPQGREYLESYLRQSVGLDRILITTIVLPPLPAGKLIELEDDLAQMLTVLPLSPLTDEEVLFRSMAKNLSDPDNDPRILQLEEILKSAELELQKITDARNGDPSYLSTTGLITWRSLDMEDFTKAIAILRRGIEETKGWLTIDLEYQKRTGEPCHQLSTLAQDAYDMGLMKGCLPFVTQHLERKNLLACARPQPRAELLSRVASIRENSISLDRKYSERRAIRERLTNESPLSEDPLRELDAVVTELRGRGRKISEFSAADVGRYLRRARIDFRAKEFDQELGSFRPPREAARRAEFFAMAHNFCELEAAFYHCCYSPSAAWLNVHTEVLQRTMTDFAAYLPSLTRIWSTIADPVRLTMGRIFVNELRKQYGIARPILLFLMNLSRSDAEFAPCTADSPIHGMIHYSSDTLRNCNVQEFLSNLQHEVVHAAQENLRNHPEAYPDECAFDRGWFLVMKEQEYFRDLKMYVSQMHPPPKPGTRWSRNCTRYEQSPHERDAFLAQYLGKSVIANALRT